MLIDDHIAGDVERIAMVTHDSARFARASGMPVATFEAMRDRIAATSARMKTAQRFVLSPQVVEACWQITERGKGADVTASRDYLFTPAERTWIEWADTQTHGVQSHRFGFWLDGQGEGNTALFIGQGLCVHDMAFGAERTNAVPIAFDFPGTGSLIRGARDSFMKMPAAAVISPDLENLSALKALDLDRLGLFLGAALALINTPRISQVVHHDLSKLNRARLKRDKPPLLSYSDVIIRPDSGWTSPSEERRMTGEMRRHHVRSHMRLTRGKCVVVRGHWRGLREKGYVLHDHVVRMTDEEAGDWKGPPKVGDRIIKPGDMDGLVDD